MMDNCFENLDDLIDTSHRGSVFNQTHVVPSVKTEDLGMADRKASFDWFPHALDEMNVPIWGRELGSSLTEDSAEAGSLLSLPQLKQELISRPSALQLQIQSAMQPAEPYNPFLASSTSSLSSPLNHSSPHSEAYPCDGQGCCEAEVVQCCSDPNCPLNKPGDQTAYAALGAPLSTAPQRIGIYSPEARRQRIQRFLEKRRKRVWDKKISYDCRKKLADTRPRIKGRFVKKEEAQMILAASLQSQAPGPTAPSTTAASMSAAYPASAAVMVAGPPPAMMYGVNVVPSGHLAYQPIARPVAPSAVPPSVSGAATPRAGSPHSAVVPTTPTVAQTPASPVVPSTPTASPVAARVPPPAPIVAGKARALSQAPPPAARTGLPLASKSTVPPPRPFYATPADVAPAPPQ